MADTATATATQALIDSLNVDIRKEHAAIVMYLMHSWGRAGSSGLGERIRRIAREEMWHMEWLGEAITGLGGTPDARRWENPFVSPSLRESLQVDVEAEKDALEHYRHTLSLLGEDHEELRRLIERIMGDEQAHEAIFHDLIGGVERLGENAFKPSAWAERVDAQRLFPNAEREYEGLLQYIWAKFACGEREEGERYFEVSIDEMHHLEWLAESILSQANPQIGESVPERIRAFAECGAALPRLSEYEDTAMAEYMRSRDAVVSEDLRKLLDRVIFQHDYHQFVLEHLEE